MTKTNHHHVKTLEQALAAVYGWKTIAEWRDKLIAEVAGKAARLGINEYAYCQSAVTSPAELQALAELVSNNETRFFRDGEQIAALKRRVIPELLAARREAQRLKIWSVACSTGEEVYSVVMLLKDALPEGWHVNMLATDLRGQAIIQATKGRYPASSLTFVEAKLRDRYFIRAEHNGREPSFDVAPVMKGLVTFRRANLCDGHFWKSLHQKFDLIICNNLLMHFHALAIKKTVDRMVEALEPSGFLTVMRNEAMFVEHAELKRDGSLAGAFFKKL
jgi:chemotaxis protein methyltransferase CheR